MLMDLYKAKPLYADDQIKLVPVYYVINCTYCPPDFCIDKNNWYCSFDPDGYGETQVATGR